MDQNKNPRLYDVYDHRTKEIKQLHELSIQDYVQKGDISLLKDKEYPVLDPEGNVGTIKGKDAYNAFNSGYQLEPYDYRVERENKEKYEGLKGQTQALAASTARGITLGLSDLGLTSTGLVDPETLRELEERNPAISNTGEILGTVGGLIIPGGAIGKGAQLASKAGAKVIGKEIGKELIEKSIQRNFLNAPGLVSQAGNLVSKAIARDSGKTAVKLAGKTAGSAIEGAFYGLGHAVSEDALGRADFTAEVLPAMGQGFAFGAVVPPIFKGIELASKPILKGASSIAMKTLDKMSEYTGKTYAKLTSAIAGVDDQLANNLFQKPFTEEGAAIRAKALKSSNDILEDSIQFSDDLAKFESEIDNFFEQTYKGQKRATEIKNLGNHDLGIEDSMGITSLLKGADDSVTTMVTEEAIHNKSLVNQYQKVIQKAKDEYSKALGSDKSKVSDYFTIIDNTKSKLQELARYDKALSPDPATMASAKMIRENATQFKNFLNNWKGSLGERQVSHNKAVNEYMNARDAFRKAFTEKNVVNGQKVYKISQTKVNTYLNQLGKLSGEKRDQVLQDYFSNTYNYLHEMGNTWKNATKDTHLIPVDSFVPNQMMKKFFNTAGGRARVNDSLKWYKEYGKLKEQMMDQGIGLSELGLAGSLGLAASTASLTPGVLAAGSAAYGIAKNPYNTMKVLSGLERIQNSVISSIKNTSKKIISGIPTNKNVGPASYNMLINSNLFGDKKQTPESRGSGYRYIADKLNEAMTNPAKYMENLNQETETLSGFAPQTAEQVKLQKLSALRFLYDKLPRPQSINIFTNKDDYVPSDFELAKFERYVAAVENPMTVFQDLENNHFSREGVETLRTIYPNIYELMMDSVIEDLSKNSKTISYKKKIQLGNLLGIDFTNSMSPQKIQMYQKSYAPVEEPQGSGVKKPLSINDQFTQMQRVEQS